MCAYTPAGTFFRPNLKTDADIRGDIHNPVRVITEHPTQMGNKMPQSLWRTASRKEEKDYLDGHPQFAAEYYRWNGGRLEIRTNAK